MQRRSNIPKAGEKAEISSQLAAADDHVAVFVLSVWASPVAHTSWGLLANGSQSQLAGARVLCTPSMTAHPEKLKGASCD